MYFWCRMSIWATKAGGGSNERRMALFAQKWLILVVSAKFTDHRGTVATRWPRGGFAFYGYLVSLVFALRLGHGGGRRAGAANEGLLSSLTRRWRIPFVKGGIYRSVGISSYPWAMMWPRELSGGIERKGEIPPTNTPE